MRLLFGACIAVSAKSCMSERQALQAECTLLRLSLSEASGFVAGLHGPMALT